MAERFSITPLVRAASGRIEEPGFYRMESAAYHRDPCPTPALSSSLAFQLLEYSPRHAWARCPRFNPQEERAPDDAMNLGSAAHAHTFGDPADIVRVEADDWRTKAAKEARAAAALAGKTALLAWMDDEARAMAAIARPLIAELLDGRAHYELAVAWRGANGGGWRRTRFDAVRDDGRVFVDLKTSAGHVAPQTYRDKLCDFGADYQEAMCFEGLDFFDEAGRSHRKMYFIAQEQTFPYEIAYFDLDSQTQTDARKRIAYAGPVWDECVRSDVWPGYDKRVHTAGLPPWCMHRRVMQEFDRRTEPAT